MSSTNYGPNAPIALSFPSDLGTPGALYPYISFSVRTDYKGGGMFSSVHLPVPAGISFNDSGSYSTIDLGPLAAGGLQDALSGMLNGSGVIDSTKAGLTSVVKQIKNLKATEAAAILAHKLPVPWAEKAKERALFGMKKITAPNTNTTFAGNSIREFSFTFSMIGKNQADVRIIRSIHELFRLYTYAGSDSGSPNLILDYPPLWHIQFSLPQPDGGTVENPYIPRIFPCYLKGISATFNQNASAWRIDGAPFEVSIGLNFQETRVLNRLDIKQLQSGQNNLGIDPTTGQATTTTIV